MSTTYVWLTPSFTPDAHIKVFFDKGRFDQCDRSLCPQLTHAITQLNIIEGYSARLVESLPSSWSSIDDSEGVQCIANKLRQGLTTCEWPVLPVLLPSIASTFGGDKATWLVANVTHLRPALLHVEIEDIQTWACTISVEKYGIRNSHDVDHLSLTGCGVVLLSLISLISRMLKVEQSVSLRTSLKGKSLYKGLYIQEKEIHVLRLWVHGWGLKFDVKFDVDPDTEQKQKIVTDI
ncbi:hypothetical protein BGY98DRAFT_1166235 [Russula aff. rugulosa BPL654]|nr:hypothetical protein BGY98DRAFT_1166235 [Russula aff. rugulosa BPL654]